MPSDRLAAIAGVYEYPLRRAEISALQIKAESAAKALEDAGLKWSDVDAIYDSGDGAAGGGLGISEYFGLKPNAIDTTQVGGSSFEFQASHATRSLAAGKSKVALLTYGSTAHSERRAIGTGGGSLSEMPPPSSNMEAPWGLTLIGNYAMVARRHMAQYGTTSEQLAEISVATRHHALRNPEAVATLEELIIVPEELTIEAVVNSRIIAEPLHLFECCLVTDGGGAVVIVAPDVAKDIRKNPVWILGTGEATKYPENGGDITTSAGAQSAPPAFAEAGITPDQIDIAMIYDSFSITVLTILEDLGFCKKGEGGAWVEGGKLAFDKPGGPALNTDGGGLSSNHPGMRGIFLLIEAARQLRGESTSQVPDARFALAHGNGGLLGTRHAGSTIIMGRE